MQEPHGLGGDERRLLGGLRDHRVAGKERRADLAEKDRERKVPRTDADENAAAAVAQRIAFTRGTRQGLGRERVARLQRIVAAEIDRLAHLAERIVEGLTALALQQRDQSPALRLD